MQNVSSDEAALDAKIERRKKEYDQQQKRLAKLQVLKIFFGIYKFHNSIRMSLILA